MTVCVAMGLFVGMALTPKKDMPLATSGPNYQKLQDIIQVIDHEYVDSVNGNALFEKAISDMLHELDPHSNYISAEDLKAMNEGIEGKFGGVGIRFYIIKDTVCVTNVLPNSPSESAGLKAGDKIIKVDGEKVAGVKISNDAIMGKLKGQEGTSVKLSLLRGTKKVDVSVIRGTIPVASVLASYMITDKVGYIKVEMFSVETANEFREAAFKLRNEGMTKLIIDLRNNGGGVLQSATDMADEFLRSGTPIVITEGEHDPKRIYGATNKGLLKDVEVAVLINSNSASASEIFAGALQDNDRGTIVGRRSFGKGLVQEDFILRDGSSLRLTIARYYTPTGRCIQKSYNGSYEDYMEDQYNRIDNGEMYEIDSTVFVDSLKYTTPKGKIVYGGGGIMPDVFVPYDSTNASWYLTQLRFSPAFTTFAFDFVSDKRNKWVSINEYNKSFVVTDAIVEQFAKFAKAENDIDINRSELNRSKPLIKQYLKSEIARQLWVEEGYYEVNNPYDKEVQEALKQLK